MGYCLVSCSAVIETCAEELQLHSCFNGETILISHSRIGDQSFQDQTFLREVRIDTR
jgi:hypothetical protein